MVLLPNLSAMMQLPTNDGILDLVVTDIIADRWSYLMAMGTAHSHRSYRQLDLRCRFDNYGLLISASVCLEDAAAGLFTNNGDSTFAPFVSLPGGTHILDKTWVAINIRKPSNMASF